MCAMVRMQTAKTISSCGDAGSQISDIVQAGNRGRNSDRILNLGQRFRSGLPHDRDQRAENDALDQAPELSRRALPDRLVERGLVGQAQSFELQPVEGNVAVGLHGREDFTADEPPRFSRQLTLVRAGTSLDRAGELFSEVDKPSGHLDLSVKEIAMNVADARKTAARSAA